MVEAFAAFGGRGVGLNEVVMKSNLMGKFAILTLAFSSAWSIGAMAQTADDGPGPSDQPSAPMEIGQEQQAQDAPATGPQGPR